MESVQVVVHQNSFFVGVNHTLVSGNAILVLLLLVKRILDLVELEFAFKLVVVVSGFFLVLYFLIIEVAFFVDVGMVDDVVLALLGLGVTQHHALSRLISSQKI